MADYSEAGIGGSKPHLDNARQIQQFDDPYRPRARQPDPTAPPAVAPRAGVLREAEQLITGDRNVHYGEPTDNFRNIGELWTTRIRHKLKDGEVLTGADVADFQMLVKLARNIAQTKRDNYVDIAGYAGCGYESFLAESE